MIVPLVDGIRIFHKCFHSFERYPLPKTSPSMLTTLLILWLARSNLRIAHHRLRKAVSILAICAIIMTCIPARCLGGDPLDRGTGGRSLADAQPKQESWPKQESRPEQESSSSKTQSDSGHEQLREGTLIPPTVGQIVLLGRRWAFVPAGREPASEDGLVTVEQKVRALAASRDSKPRPTRLGDAARTKVHSSARYRPATLVRKDTTLEAAGDLNQPHLVVVENLMLQRIVEAIRADSSDDRWTVSGQVTEFFKENRLLIHTAQRANSN
jgi:hypothetical protein